MIFVIKLFVNSKQIRLLNDKTIESDWYYSGPNNKLKFLAPRQKTI